MLRFREWLLEPGLIKTPIFAASGWTAWHTVKGVLEASVLVGTATIVFFHVTTAVARRWCPRRRFSDRLRCYKCPLQGSFFCPRGLESEDEQ